MDARVHNLLYDNPRLYDIVFPDAGETELAMCRTAFSRWLAAPPQSALDLGCGTAMNLERTFATFAAHAHPGTLLLFDLLNARCYLEGDGFQERVDGKVDTPEFSATTVSIHTLDRDARLLARTRTWRIPGQPDVVDHAEYRLIYPEEARRLAEGAGFEWLAGYDNREFRESGLTGTIKATPDCAGMHGRKLYAFARKT